MAVSGRSGPAASASTGCKNLCSGQSFRLQDGFSALSFGLQRLIQGQVPLAVSQHAVGAQGEGREAGEVSSPSLRLTPG